MPTAPKLIGLLYFALLAFFAASLVIPYLDEGTQVGKLGFICAAFGGLVGWSFSGARAGDTMRAAYGYGLTAAALIVLYCVFYFSFEEMLHRSISKRYGGPTEAVLSCFKLMREHVVYVLKWDVLTILILGGLFGGWLVEKTGRKWP